MCSRQMFDDLTALGCVERKSLTLQFPMLPSSLNPHFIRGYFDGDGSICIDKRYGTPTVSLVGNPEFLEVIQTIVMAATNAEGKLSRHYSSKAWYLRYCGNFKVAVIGAWMYQDASIWLGRKREKFESFPVERGAAIQHLLCINGTSFRLRATSRSKPFCATSKRKAKEVK